MATHLSKENIENYLERSLSHEELPQINEHLYGCEACYHQFLGLLEKRRFPIVIDLDELSGLKGWHIQGEDLKAYVEGRMDQLDLDYANLHLAECAWCREEVDNYSEFGTKIPYYLSRRHVPLKQSILWNRYYPYLRVAALILLMLGSAIIFWSVVETKHSEVQEESVSESFEKERSLQTQSPEDTSSPSQPTTKSQEVFRQKTRQSALPRPGSKPSSTGNRLFTDQQETDETLISRNLVMPSAIEIFDRSAIILRGNGNHDKSFNIIGPYSTVISNDRPTFRWTALNGADSYTVSVYDADLNLVKTSDPLSETQWQVPKRLRRGELYTWMVTALKDGEEILAPSPPARVEFKVIEKAELVSLNRRIMQTRSHAARGVLLAEAGLLDEAEQEFQAHLTLLPTDERARQLLQEIKSWREP